MSLLTVGPNLFDSAHMIKTNGPRLSSTAAVLVTVALFLALSVVVYVFYSFHTNARKNLHIDNEEYVSNVYEDEDGVATEKAQKERGTTIPAWVLLAILTPLVILQRDSIKRYHHGRYCGLSIAILAASNCIQIYNLARSLKRNVDGATTPLLVLTAVETVCAFALCIAFISFPRRPDVELKGHPVDRQYTVSSLSYWTLTWARDVMSVARTKESLELKDLPILHYRARSSYLLSRFGTEIGKRPLWLSLLYMHWPVFVYQTILAMVFAAIQFIPQLSMFGLLRVLEQRNTSAVTSPEAWFLVLALGASIVLASWADCWNAWIAYADLGIPVRSELSALVFAKATRRKDVKEAGSAKSETGNVDPNLDEQIPAVATASRSTPLAASMEGSSDDLEKTRQGTINLMSVDAKRVSDFLQAHYLFVEVATTLTVSVVFLIQLLGWLPVLAGFLVFSVQIPLNIFTSKRFIDAEDELMQVRDRKLMVLTEALQGIRQIKFSAQENQWQDRIRSFRKAELAVQWRAFRLDTILVFCWILGPILLSAVAISTYAALHGTLSASLAFTSISIFAAIEFSLAVIPEFTSDGLEAWVSCRRIEDYLKASECEDRTLEDSEIVFRDATIAWPSDQIENNELVADRFTLRSLSFRLPKKELSVISGATGTGKSLLLASLIGEAEILVGQIRKPRSPSYSERCDENANKNDWIIDSSMAYVAQIPWIENATIRANILFGLPYDRGRYNKVVESCALTKDLEILTDGDSTDIGFNGINLSGGQRWRITFARALYSRAGILVLDDIFSAVDAHVGRQLFEDALTGELGEDRTRILVTHHVDLVLPKAAYIVTLAEGTVQYAGGPEAFRETGELERVQPKEPRSLQQTYPQLRRESTAHEDEDLRKVMSVASCRSNLIDRSGPELAFNDDAKKFIEDETKEKGSIKLGIYKEYFKTSGSLKYWTPIFGLYIFHQMLSLSRSWFVSFWTRSYETEAANNQSINLSGILSQVTLAAKGNPDLSFYLGIYLGMSVVLCVSGTLRFYLVYTRSIRASKILFEKMTHTVLRTSLRWLDTVPLGRVLNRFTADFEAIDSKIAGNIGSLAFESLQLLSIVAAAVFISPFMLLVALLLFLLCLYEIRWYLDGAREIKRLESIAKSPIFDQFGATLSGIGTIRAFDKTDIYLNRMFDKIDGHARAFWHILLFNRWVAFRLDIIGAAFSTFIGAFVAFANVDASLAGFALSFALQYSSAITWATRFYSTVELSMNAVERVSEYSKLPTESQEAKREAPAAWPTGGRLEVNDLVIGYAPDLPSVLKGLNFRAESRQRIGVVGRTGAGKSSLTLALFRFLEAREGNIIIDGINIADISLQVLRSRLAIIPQDPVLFSGTVRSNLDPFDEHTDDDLRDALQRVQLSRSSSTGTFSRAEAADTTIDPLTSTSSTPPPPSHLPPRPTKNTNAPISLTTPISESGLNLSQGQRQLLCLARAIVRRPKILVLDEATSAVDMETDLLIQRSIRKEFQDSTLLVIAHRLSTIADFDRVLVMQEGKGVEFGTPRELVGMRDGVFKGLVEESGGREELKRIILEE